MKPECGDLIENTIVEIYTDSEDKTRCIHYFAYGYCSENDEPLNCRFLEYTFFIVPLKDVLDFKGGVYGYESEFGADYKQYIEDCDEQTMINRYLHYDNGRCPKFIDSNELNMNTPDGMYILIWRED